MSKPIAEFIGTDFEPVKEPAGSFPRIESTSHSGNGHSDGVSTPVERIGNPEPIGEGFETIDFTESANANTASVTDAGTGTKLNRNGSIDGRTKAGRANRTPKSTNPLGDKLTLTDLLFSGHQMLAGITSVQELELDRSEAERLGDAAYEVGKHYALTLDPKKAAIINLCFVAGAIYGTRIVAYRLRRSKEKPARLTVMGPSEKPADKTYVNGAPKPVKLPHEMSPSDLWPESAAIEES